MILGETFARDSSGLCFWFAAVLRRCWALKREAGGEEEENFASRQRSKPNGKSKNMGEFLQRVCRMDGARKRKPMGIDGTN